MPLCFAMRGLENPIRLVVVVTTMMRFGRCCVRFNDSNTHTHRHCIIIASCLCVWCVWVWYFFSYIAYTLMICWRCCCFCCCSGKDFHITLHDDHQWMNASCVFFAETLQNTWVECATHACTLKCHHGQKFNYINNRAIQLYLMPMGIRQWKKHIIYIVNCRLVFGFSIKLFSTHICVSTHVNCGDYRPHCWATIAVEGLYEAVRFMI